MKASVPKKRGTNKGKAKPIRPGKPAKAAASTKKAKATPAGASRRRAKVAQPTIAYHPGRLIDCEAALAEAAEKLMAQDPALIGKLVEIGGPPPLRRREPGFSGLAAIIVSQQVSVASANAIYGRLERRIAPLEAGTLRAASEEDLRACGLSSPKIRALRALADAIETQDLDLGSLGGRDAIDAHRALIRVSGVGPWTADIFLLFCLGHPDAFPAGDLALQEAAKLALGLETRPDARELERIAERWRPFRGVAARMLWAFYRVAKLRSGMALADASG